MSLDSDRVFIIAEAGVNHNGSLDLARDLVRAAAEAGADAVKFQSFVADKLALKSARMADYQIANTGAEQSQHAMLKALELSSEEQVSLQQYAREQGIEFMSSPFDPDSVDFLAGTVKVARLKIPSGEVTNGLLMLRAWRSGLPMIVSSGMCSLDEVLESLSLLAWAAENSDSIPQSRDELAKIRSRPDWTRVLKSRIWLLQCVTQYPTPVEKTNLRVMESLSKATGLKVGFSDHSIGWHITTASVAAGAKVVEKHFTMSRDLPGPDHLASLEPDELSRMIREVRDVELALGSEVKAPNEVELKNRISARGSIVAARAIPVGKLIEINDLAVKRPGTGAGAFHIWDLIGRTVQHGFLPDDQIDPGKFK